MPQPGGCGHGKLRIGTRSISVDILDESAGGFMIAAEKIPRNIPVAKPIELITSSGRHPLRIVWRRNVDGETRLGLQRLPDEILWREESSWFVWMVAAVVLGFGIGYMAAFRDQDNMINKIVELTGSGAVVNNPHVEPPNE